MSVLGKLNLIAPEFSTLANLQDYINLAEEQVSAKMCKRELAVAYLAAHIISMANRGGAAGAIASESEGGLSRSFGPLDNNLLASTSYGQEYLRLLKSCLPGFYMRTFPA